METPPPSATDLMVFWKLSNPDKVDRAAQEAPRSPPKRSGPTRSTPAAAPPVSTFVFGRSPAKAPATAGNARPIGSARPAGPSPGSLVSFFDAPSNVGARPSAPDRTATARPSSFLLSTACQRPDLEQRARSRSPSPRGTRPPCHYAAPEAASQGQDDGTVVEEEGFWDRSTEACVVDEEPPFTPTGSHPPAHTGPYVRPTTDGGHRTPTLFERHVQAELQRTALCDDDGGDHQEFHPQEPRHATHHPQQSGHPTTHHPQWGAAPGSVPRPLAQPTRPTHVAHGFARPQPFGATRVDHAAAGPPASGNNQRRSPFRPATPLRQTWKTEEPRAADPTTPPWAERVTRESTRAMEEDPEIVLEKQGYLIELQKLKLQGITLLKEYTMEDSLADIKFEYERHQTNLDTINTVAFMRDMMKMGLQGIEMLNNKMGPFLALDGWSTEATKDMKRYDHSLERIYKRYWRRTEISPIAELAMVLVGSMGMWHLKAKMHGPSRNDQQSCSPDPVPQWQQPPGKGGCNGTTSHGVDPRNAHPPPSDRWSPAGEAKPPYSLPAQSPAPAHPSIVVTPAACNPFQGNPSRFVPSATVDAAPTPTGRRKTLRRPSPNLRAGDGPLSALGNLMGGARPGSAGGLAGLAGLMGGVSMIPPTPLPDAVADYLPHQIPVM